LLRDLITNNTTLPLPHSQNTPHSSPLPPSSFPQTPYPPLLPQAYEYYSAAPTLVTEEYAVIPCSTNSAQWRMLLRLRKRRETRSAGTTLLVLQTHHIISAYHYLLSPRH
jgi:hypothetical protein